MTTTSMCGRRNRSESNQRIGFGSIHALFTCRQQGFLPNDSDDALWQELKLERFTTPLLRGWLPHVRKELELKTLLAGCYALDFTCCVLTVASADVDPIIESGLKHGLISIQAEAAWHSTRASKPDPANTEATRVRTVIGIITSGAPSVTEEVFKAR
jgi:hypothetical protein